jgi:hypothetical protein
MAEAVVLRATTALAAPLTADLVLIAEPAAAEGVLPVLSIRDSPGRAVITDVQTLVRRMLAPLSAGERARVLELLTRELATPRSAAAAIAVSEALARVARVLRERLPYSVGVPGDAREVRVDMLVALDDRIFYASGFAFDIEAQIASLVAISPEGSRRELTDVANESFRAWFELPVPSLLDHGWRFELRNVLGVGVEVEAPRVLRDLEQARDAVLADLATTDAQQLHTAIERLQERLRCTVEVEAVHEFGSRNPASEISLVIPVGRRHELVEQQLAQFAHDAELKGVDLIYVVVEPEPRFLESAAELERLYRVPFRFVILSQDPGEAVAADLGVAFAEGPLLAFLHPDALPARPGWLRAMAAAHASESGIGAVASARLDQHDSPSTSEAPVACLLVATDLYRSLGGLDGDYLTADGGLADLCLRTTGGVRRMPEAGLYCVDDFYSTDRLAAAGSRYDAWLLVHRPQGGSGS